MFADKATNPEQYNSPEMNWQILGAETARQYFRDALDSFIESGSLEGKRVIDIGSGTGHLFNWLKEHGAISVTGIDPAAKNIAISAEKYPWATSIVSTLNDFPKNNSEKFDVAIVILAFEHIEDLSSAFHDVNTLLETGGKFYLIITDKSYHLSNDKEIRSEQFVGVEIIRNLDGQAVETKTVRDLGDGKQSVMFDILRPIENVRAAAQNNGFKLFSEKALTSQTIKPSPMLHVLGFVKES